MHLQLDVVSKKRENKRRIFDAEEGERLVVQRQLLISSGNGQYLRKGIGQVDKLSNEESSEDLIEVAVVDNEEHSLSAVMSHILCPDWCRVQSTRMMYEWASNVSHRDTNFVTSKSLEKSNPIVRPRDIGGNDIVWRREGRMLRAQSGSYENDSPCKNYGLLQLTMRPRREKREMASMKVATRHVLLNFDISNLDLTFVVCGILR
ncbi:hypothetical protein C8R41DRAFT_869949 [Lentinula lateritia]|uniref:Uncharacterized protein n=1 Tax=Lentinula lateritia TaxID=40482 RepID=A0ABQ8V9C6_9AGAR|nr:hypothetical protein C8R41DRAFT_869949 [Lentinula lateritia]